MCKKEIHKNPILPVLFFSFLLKIAICKIFNINMLPLCLLISSPETVGLYQEPGASLLAEFEQEVQLAVFNRRF